jgi:DNA-binding response OmpR family regulator
MSEPMHALVVDDEPAVRRLTVRALQRYSFICDEAEDGEQATEFLAHRKYHVLVTDLRMPKRNGHALAVELIGRGVDRPVIVVLTGVLEPKLATDLIARGVDDITFKPVDFNVFGAKVRALCDRHAQNKTIGALPHARASQADDFGNFSISIHELEQRLDQMAHILPVSRAAIEVANLIDDGSPSMFDVGKLVVRDAALCVEVLRSANAPDCNPAGARIDDLQQAITRLGHQRISELAIAAPRLQDLAQDTLN